MFWKVVMSMQQYVLQKMVLWKIDILLRSKMSTLFKHLLDTMQIFKHVQIQNIL